MKRCPNCGGEVKDDLAQEGFCNHCGQDFDPAAFAKTRSFSEDDRE